MTNLTYVTPGYFETLRVPLRQGRLFREPDRATRQRVAIVNEAFVQKYLRGQEVLGNHIGDERLPCEIVGLVGDVQQRGVGWGNYGPIAPVAHMYIPAAQTNDSAVSLIHTWFSPSWVVRSSLPLDQLAVALQGAVASVDPQLPFASFQTMDQVRSRSLAFQRLEATLLGSIAGLALLLAAIGIYGMIASSVTERTRKFRNSARPRSSVAQAVRAVAVPGIVMAAIESRSRLHTGTRHGHLAPQPDLGHHRRPRDVRRSLRAFTAGRVPRQRVTRLARGPHSTCRHSPRRIELRQKRITVKPGTESSIRPAHREDMLCRLHEVGGQRLRDVHELLRIPVRQRKP